MFVMNEQIMRIKLNTSYLCIVEQQQTPDPVILGASQIKAAATRIRVTEEKEAWTRLGHAMMRSSTRMDFTRPSRANARRAITHSKCRLTEH
jgi:hypothetical protein